MNKSEKNPFQEIAPKEEAPKELKKQVMASIELGHMLMDMTELFTIKMGNTAMQMMDSNALHQNKPRKNTEDGKGQE